MHNIWFRIRTPAGKSIDGNEIVPESRLCWKNEKTMPRNVPVPSGAGAGYANIAP